MAKIEQLSLHLVTLVMKCCNKMFTIYSFAVRLLNFLKIISALQKGFEPIWINKAIGIEKAIIGKVIVIIGIVIVIIGKVIAISGIAKGHHWWCHSHHWYYKRLSLVMNTLISNVMNTTGNAKAIISNIMPAIGNEKGHHWYCKRPSLVLQKAIIGYVKDHYW